MRALLSMGAFLRRMISWDTFFGVILILLIWFLFMEAYFPC